MVAKGIGWFPSALKTTKDVGSVERLGGEVDESMTNGGLVPIERGCSKGCAVEVDGANESGSHRKVELLRLGGNEEREKSVDAFEGCKKR